ncbi:Gamma-aminobutyraldehyde dehydrogenase [Streptomyces alboniger]
MHNPGTGTPDRFAARERFAEGAQFIAGRPTKGTSGRTHAVVDPSTGEEVYTYELAGAADVDAAVAAARAAFPGWSSTTPGERSDALHRFAGVLADRAEDFARAESLQCGKPLKLTREFDVPGTIDNTAFFAGAARHLQGQSAGEYSGDHTSYVRREAIGVVGSIAPWNYPPDGGLEDPPGDRRGQHDRAEARRAHPAHLRCCSRRPPPTPGSPTV